MLQRHFVGQPGKPHLGGKLGHQHSFAAVTALMRWSAHAVLRIMRRALAVSPVVSGYVLHSLKIQLCVHLGTREAYVVQNVQDMLLQVAAVPAHVEGQLRPDYRSTARTAASNEVQARCIWSVNLSAINMFLVSLS
jgi:hypothetical protein